MTSVLAELDPALLARATAVRKAEAKNADLETHVQMANAILDARRSRHNQRKGDQVSMERHLQELHEVMEQLCTRRDLLVEGVLACDSRLALSRRNLAETMPALEALRAHSALAAEKLRLESIQLGLLHGRVAEKRQQLSALQQKVLEQRIRVGLLRWQPRYTLLRALGRWHQHYQDCKSKTERTLIDE